MKKKSGVVLIMIISIIVIIGVVLAVKFGTSKETMELKVGDYVNYSPVVSKYTPDDSKTGSTENTEQDTNLVRWRVLSINKSNGKALITTEKPVNSVTLAGAEGYLYGPQELNVLCEKLYSNVTKYGVTAHCMTVEELIDACGITPSYCYAFYPSGTVFAPNDRIIKNTTNGKDYIKITMDWWPDDKLYADSWYTYVGGGKAQEDGFIPEINNPIYIEMIESGDFAYYPEDTSIIGDAIVGGYMKSNATNWLIDQSTARFLTRDEGGELYEEDGITYYRPTDINPLYLKRTGVSYYAVEEINQTVGMVLTDEYAWLASNCVLAIPKYASYSVQTANANNISEWGIFGSNGSSRTSHTLGVRPVVSIDLSLIEKENVTKN